MSTGPFSFHYPAMYECDFLISSHKTLFKDLSQIVECFRMICERTISELVRHYDDTVKQTR